MVPFLRAVRGEKEESRSDQAERSEGATNWGQGSPQFGSFYQMSCPKRWNVFTKLGRNGVWVKPDGTSSTVLDFATLGAELLSARGQKFPVFAVFSGV